MRPWLGLLITIALLGAWLTWGVRSSDGAGPATVSCGKPAKLKLRRYEDGSAKLLCGRRLLVRVRVPW